MQYIKFILAMLIFGTIGILAKNIAISSTQIVLGRTVIATIVFLLVFLLTSKKLEYKNILKNLHYLLLAGVSLAFSWIFLFESFNYSSVSVSVWITYLQPIIVILLAPILLKDKLNLLKIVCILLSIVGLYFVSGIDINNFEVNKGVWLALLSATTYALIVILNKKMKNIDGLNTTFIQMSFAALTMIVYVFFVKGEVISFPDTKSVILLVILGVVHTGLACFLMFSAIPKLPTNNVAFLSYLDPIFTIVFAYFILGEVLTTSQLIGTIFILGAAVVAQLRK